MNLKGRRFENSKLELEIFVYDVEGKEMFIGKDIAKLLGYSNPSTAVSENIKPSQKKKVYVRTVENIGSDVVKTMNNNLTLITKEGVLNLVSKSQKINSNTKQKWLRALGVDVVIQTRLEIEFGSMLVEALKEINLTVKTQCDVDGFRVDFYIPEENVCVEYDEAHHLNPINEMMDIERQKHIEGKTGAKFIRCDYRDSNIKNIVKVLKEVM